MQKNITFSADPQLIQRARERAARERRTLNAVFRDWLARYAATDRSPSSYETLMKHLSYARPGRTFSRDDLNER